MLNEQRKPIGDREADWIADLLLDNQQFEATRLSLKRARILLFSGQQPADWFQLGDLYFRQIGAIDSIKVGHICDGGVIYLGIFVVLNALTENDISIAESNLIRYLKTEEINPNPSLSIETVVDKKFRDGKVGTTSRAIMKLDDREALKQLVTGKVWSM